jgi:HK97 gp10 family phage protein
MEVTGLKELNKRLTKLPERIERNIMSAAVRAGANEIKKAAVANLGGKKSDIVVKKSRAPKGTTKYKVGINAKKFYLYFKEFGTKPHVIKNKKGLLTNGSVVFGRIIDHPGQPAKPFLRPAFDENTLGAITAMAKKIKQRLEKEAAKK